MAALLLSLLRRCSSARTTTSPSKAAAELARGETAPKCALAVSSAVLLGVVACAPPVLPRILPEVPSGPSDVEVSPVIINGAEIQQEIARAYPPDLLARGLGGRVEVWVHVDLAGRGRSGGVKTSSGNDALDCAAMQVANIMEFGPARNQGDIWISEWIEFQPEESAEESADPDRHCEPWDTPLFRLESNDIGLWMQRLYPPELRRRGVGGSVALKLFVETSGEVVKYEVVESSGYEALDDAAGMVAMNIRFEPAKRLGRPIGVWTAQRLTFRSRSATDPERRR